MVGTLARLLAEKQIETPAENFWADVQGDIEEVNGVLRITQIRVDYHLKLPAGKKKTPGKSWGCISRGVPQPQALWIASGSRTKLCLKSLVEQSLLNAILSIRVRAFERNLGTGEIYRSSRIIKTKSHFGYNREPIADKPWGREREEHLTRSKTRQRNPGLLDSNSDALPFTLTTSELLALWIRRDYTSLV